MLELQVHGRCLVDLCSYNITLGYVCIKTFRYVYHTVDQQILLFFVVLNKENVTNNFNECILYRWNTYTCVWVIWFWSFPISISRKVEGIVIHQWCIWITSICRAIDCFGRICVLWCYRCSINQSQCCSSETIIMNTEKS